MPWRLPCGTLSERAKIDKIRFFSFHEAFIDRGTASIARVNPSKGTLAPGQKYHDIQSYIVTLRLFDLAQHERASF
jgi:hypothetical protein